MLILGGSQLHSLIQSDNQNIKYVTFPVAPVDLLVQAYNTFFQTYKNYFAK